MGILRHADEFSSYQAARNCPFCSSGVTVCETATPSGHTGYFVKCSNCFCTIRSPIFSSSIDAIDWWNGTHDFNGLYENRIE